MANQFTNNFVRGADMWELVEVGMIRYVGSPVAGEDIAACVVTKILPSILVYDPECGRRVRVQQYQIRRATGAEEAGYRALLAPRSAGIGLGAAADYRAEV